MVLFEAKALLYTCVGRNGDFLEDQVVSERV